MLLRAAATCGLDIHTGMPDEGGMGRIARELVKMRMPFAIACNKMDAQGARAIFEKVKRTLGAEGVFPCSAAVELALRKAVERGLIRYRPGDSGFDVCGAPDERQAAALLKMRGFLSENGGSGVQEIVDWVVYEKLQCMVVYPVEDEHRCTNHKGEILPDAFLVPKGTTAVQLASMVHTDLAQKFIGAFDVKRKIRVGADHALANGDVIKIIAGR